MFSVKCRSTHHMYRMCLLRCDALWILVATAVGRCIVGCNEWTRNEMALHVRLLLVRLMVRQLLLMLLLVRHHRMHTQIVERILVLMRKRMLRNVMDIIGRMETGRGTWKIRRHHAVAVLVHFDADLGELLIVLDGIDFLETGQRLGECCGVVSAVDLLANGLLQSFVGSVKRERGIAAVRSK